MSADTYIGDYSVEVTATSPTRWEWIAASLGDVCACEIHLPDLTYEERLEVDRVLARRDRERQETASKITSETGE